MKIEVIEAKRCCNCGSSNLTKTLTGGYYCDHCRHHTNDRGLTRKVKFLKGMRYNNYMRDDDFYYEKPNKKKIEKKIPSQKPKTILRKRGKK